jgi:hypothetical protein
MADFDFDDLDALERIAVNLFYGWGYNSYRSRTSFAPTT